MKPTSQPTPPEYPEFETAKKIAKAVFVGLATIIVGLVALAVALPFGLMTPATKRKLDAEKDAPRKG